MKLLLYIICILLPKLCLAVNIYLDINNPGDNPYYTREIHREANVLEITLKAVEGSGFVSVREGGTVIWTCYKSQAIAVILILDYQSRIIKGVSLSFRYNTAVITKIYILRVADYWMFVSRTDFNEYTSNLRRGVVHPIGLPNPTVFLDLNYRLGTDHIDVKEKPDNYILDVIFIPKPKVNVTSIFDSGMVIWRYNDKVPDKIVASINKLNNQLVLTKLRFDASLYGLYYIFLLKHSNKWIPITKNIYKTIHNDVVLGNYNEKYAIIDQKDAYIDVRRVGNYSHYTTNTNTVLSHTICFESKPTTKYRISRITDGNFDIHKCNDDEEISAARHYHDPQSREPVWLEVCIYNPGRDAALVYYYNYNNNQWQPGIYQDFEKYMRNEDEQEEEEGDGEDEESNEREEMQT